jgi:hypothetical protein
LRQISEKLDAMKTIKVSAEAIEAAAAILLRAGQALHASSGELSGSSGELREASAKLHNTVKQPVNFYISGGQPPTAPVAPGQLGDGGATR